MIIRNGKMNSYQHILWSFGPLKCEFGKVFFNAPEICTFPQRSQINRYGRFGWKLIN